MAGKFQDNRVKVKEALNDDCISWLYEAAGELQSETARNTRVDTGQLAGSWSYNVDENKGEAVIGSPLQNAIWEEFGTGQYALNGNGRKTAWAYKDSKGHFHKTKGKTPTRALHKAFTTKKTQLQKRLEDILKGMG